MINAATVLSSVGEFHKACDVELLSQLREPTEREVLIALRAALVDEEMTEVIEAHRQYLVWPTIASRIALAKETADLLYVVAGTMHVLELPMDDCPYRVPEIVAPDKGVRALSRTVRWFLELLHSLGRCYYRGFPQNEREQLLFIAEEGNQVVMNLALLCAIHRIPIQHTFDQVHASNMTKVDSTTGKVRRRDDGKILKSESYREPDFDWLQTALQTNPVFWDLSLFFREEVA